MPTIGIYVPMNVARRVAERWKIDVKDDDFSELVRGICYAALTEDGQFEHAKTGFDPKCEYAKFHQLARFCRHCGGS